MAKEFSEAEMNKVLFMNLVMMFSTTAMQQLGKLVNPITQQAGIDLHGAQASIDILTMLSEKTRGRLDKEEERLLREAISALQLNYVETAESAAKMEGTKQEKKGASGSGEAGPEAAAEDVVKLAAAEPSEKTPKFHKNYGEG
jgi:uncharacterized protein YjaG (DUF416 family)